MHLLEVNLHTVHHWLFDPNKTNRSLDYWRWQIMQKWGQKEPQIKCKCSVSTNLVYQ